MKYFPHRFCLLDNWQLIWTNVVADSAIFLSYWTIATIMFLVAYRTERLVRFIEYVSSVGSWVLRLFGFAFILFIVWCGNTHGVTVITFFEPVYVVDAVVRVITAILSVFTAVALAAVYWRFRAYERESEADR